VKPRTEEELSTVVKQRVEKGVAVRAVGSLHSSTPLFQDGDIIVSLEHFKGMHGHDIAANRATIGAGTVLKDASAALNDAGLALYNLGDVNVQTIGGAIGTGTHGTGKELRNLAWMLTGVRMVDGRGEIVEKSMEEDPDFLNAARVSLGALGIFTEVSLRLLPAYRLHRREWCARIDQCMENLDALIAENRNFDFYWYPRSDLARLRTLNEASEKPKEIPYARLVKEWGGPAGEVIARVRAIKFAEMEYALPAEAGPECFREVRRRVKERHRKIVAWRVLYRTVAGDDAYLSTAHARNTVTISLLQNAALPFEEYFNDIEPVFRSYGGRPHWGKHHNLRAKELKEIYPMWDAFLRIRERMDPGKVFLNRYLRDLFGVG
jgi:FAD/FMN-containing dehydrogenase